MEKRIEKTRIVNQKSLVAYEDDEPVVLINLDITKFIAKGINYSLYGREAINDMKEVCEDALAPPEASV